VPFDDRPEPREPADSDAGEDEGGLPTRFEYFKRTNSPRFKPIEIVEIDCAGMNLRGRDFSNGGFPSLISGADLTGANLSGLNLYEISATDAIFRSANCSNTVWEKLDLEGVDFTDANLGGAEFIDCRFVGDSIFEARLNVHFSGCEFEAIDPNRIPFADCYFEGTDFSRMNFDGVNFHSASFDDCAFNRSTFVGASFTACSFVVCNFGAANLSRTSFNDDAGPYQFSNCWFIGADLSGASFFNVYSIPIESSSYFDECEFISADLTNSSWVLHEFEDWSSLRTCNRGLPSERPQRSRSATEKVSIPRGLRYQVFERDKHRCLSCGRSRRKYRDLELHVDHVVPESKGGLTRIDNLQTLCKDCNLGKGNRYDTDLR
jgi:uncharacterized protein YjbI with pentapeptide repeats